MESSCGLNIVPLIPVFVTASFSCGNLRLSPTDPHNLRIVVAFVPSLLVGFVKAFDDCDLL